MKKLLIATQNRGKFKEFVDILQDLPFKFLNLNDLSREIADLDVKETGKTFAENAILKAKAYGQASGLLVLADDSGLCVDWLKGKPGINSHRFIKGTDEDRNQKLLKIMTHVPEQKRCAIFVSIIAFFDPSTKLIKTTKGECHGRIAFEPKGKHGFGYDPIFMVDSLGKHFAELTLEEKNQISHRAKALRKMRKVLLKTLKE